MDKCPVSFTLNVPAAITGGREAVGHKIVSNSALDLIKKKLQDSGAPVTVSPTIGTSPGVATAVKSAASVDVSNGKGLGVEGAKEKPHRGDHACSDESSESEDEDLELTKERKVYEFKVGFGLVKCLVSFFWFFGFRSFSARVLWPQTHLKWKPEVYWVHRLYARPRR